MDEMSMNAPIEKSQPPVDVPAEQTAQTPPTDARTDADTEPHTVQTDYEQIARSDLLALKCEFPELMPLRDLTELADPLRYGALRDLGLTPREAYLATAAPVRRATDNRAHLQSTRLRSVVGETDTPIPANDLRAARELFSDLSDAQIRKLYKKVNT